MTTNTPSPDGHLYSRLNGGFDTFGRRLRWIRSRRDLSQVALARLAELDPAVISHFESGRREPSLGNLRKLAKALDVTSDWLIGLSKSTRRLAAP
jgi:transcriptional regulator with XRE-family HTH domain